MKWQSLLSLCTISLISRRFPFWVIAKTLSLCVCFLRAFIFAVIQYYINNVDCWRQCVINYYKSVFIVIIVCRISHGPQELSWIVTNFWSTVVLRSFAMKLSTQMGLFFFLIDSSLYVKLNRPISVGFSLWNWENERSEGKV